MKEKQMKKQNQKEYVIWHKELYKQIRQLGDNRGKNRDLPIRDENELTIHNEQEQLKRWYEYFKDKMNILPDNTDLSEILDVPEMQMNTQAPSRGEISQALQEMKCGKAAGNDMITADVLKIEINIVTYLMLSPKKSGMKRNFPGTEREA
ncbi:hypothetical protein HHI36_005694 [Cryptolaemus montrouzieri]|uniref:Uncharacterized protein n=1 Tax=Cryptolaemus montrouzieri TaxID=559131 RepID=A0ABD2NVE1_9CUCU